MTTRWSRGRCGGCAAAVLAAAAAAVLVATGGGAVQAPGGAPAAWPVAAFSSELAHTAVVPTSLRRSATTWIGGPTKAVTGETVTVYVSALLASEFRTPQGWADFFAGLVHGSELSSLTAYVATYAEIQSICGSDDALGCYGWGELYTIGEPLPWADPQDVATHEYGHHVALNRDNHPWQAVDWGTKRWASVANICARAATGAVYPGDEGDRYKLNPGEGFAEVYRATNEWRKGASSFDWQVVDGSFYPDSVALQAVEQDVLKPWTKSSASVARPRFTANGKKTWTLSVATPLDGQLTATLSLPTTKPYKLLAAHAGRQAARCRGLVRS